MIIVIFLTTLQLSKTNAIVAIVPATIDIIPDEIRPNGNTGIVTKQDASVDVTAYNSYDVTEPDGDICKSSVLGGFGDNGASNTRVYPGDFEIQVANGDGICNTQDSGTYTVNINVTDFVCTFPNPPGCPAATPGEPGIEFQNSELTDSFIVSVAVTVIRSSTIDIDPGSILDRIIQNGIIAIAVSQDPTTDATQYQSYWVTEPDGDTCEAVTLGSFKAPSNSRTYPSDFQIKTIGGDGICDTQNLGTYDVSINVTDFICIVIGPCDEFIKGNAGIEFKDSKLAGDFAVGASLINPSILTIDPEIIETNDTTDITVTQDPTVVGTEYRSYNVTEPDSDICRSAVLGGFGDNGASNTRTYPNDFVIDTINGDGLCNTTNTGEYDVSIIVRDFTCSLSNPPGCPSAAPGEPGIEFQDTNLLGQFEVTPNYFLVLKSLDGSEIFGTPENPPNQFLN